MAEKTHKQNTNQSVIIKNNLAKVLKNQIKNNVQT